MKSKNARWTSLGPFIVGVVLGIQFILFAAPAYAGNKPGREAHPKALQQATNWYVITGGPSSGKSKLLDALAFHGFQVIPEAARILIDEKLSLGQSLKDIRGNEEAFQLEILKMKI